MSNPVILATGGYDHKIRFWEAASGICTRTILFGESQVNCLQISPDKSLLAAGGNPQMQLFDLRSIDEKPLLTMDSHSNNVTSVGFQRDMKWLFSASEDGTLRIWDPRTTKPTRSYDCGGSINSAVLHPNQVDLITGDQNGCVKIWDLEADKCREEYTPSDVAVRSITIMSDGTQLAAGLHNGCLLVYTVTEQRTLDLFKEVAETHKSAYLLKCVYAPNMASLVTTSSDKSVKVWNTETWTAEKTLLQHQRWVWDAAFSSDSQYLVTVSTDQSAKLWDLHGSNVVRTFTGHNLTVSCVALNDSTT